MDKKPLIRTHISTEICAYITSWITIEFDIDTFDRMMYVNDLCRAVQAPGAADGSVSCGQR